MSRQQQPLIPFRENCRQRIVNCGIIPYAANQTATPLEMPRVGLINALILQFVGTLETPVVPVVPVDLSPFGIINRLKFDINLGSASIVDVSGYGAFLLSNLVERGFKSDRDWGVLANASGYGDGIPDNLVYDYNLTNVGATRDIRFTLVIPIAVNDAMGFSTGMINLQAPEVRATIGVTWNDETSINAASTGLTGSLQCFYRYYEMPDPYTTEIPPLTLHRTLEESQPIHATGEQLYTVPRMGVLLQLAHMNIINGVRSSFYDNFQIRFNKTDTPYRQSVGVMRALNRMHYGFSMPFGVVVHDFFHATQEVSEGDLRDAIDTEAISTVESTYDVPTGTALGLGNNRMISIRRIMQDISQRTA